MAGDFSLWRPDAARAVAKRLVTEDWYRAPIKRKSMAALMRRADRPAVRDRIVLFDCMVDFTGLAIILMPSWWSTPSWLAHGVPYGSAMDLSWHEYGRGKAFAARMMNKVVHHIASLCMIQNPPCCKSIHARHHSETINMGRDAEVAIMRPSPRFRW